jgi:WD40 repeat protein
MPAVHHANGAEAGTTNERPESVQEGRGASLNVQADSSTPLAYQWLYVESQTRSDSSVGLTPVPGATNATLSLSPVIRIYAGYYVVAISIATVTQGSGPVPFSWNSQRFAAGGGTGLVELFSVTNRERVSSFTNGPGAVFSLAFSPDDQLLAVSGEDAPIRLRRVSDGTLVAEFSQANAPGPTLASAFSPDGQWPTERG